MSLETRIPPPVAFVAIAIAMWLTSRFVPLFVMPDRLKALFVGIPLLLGLILGPPAIRAFIRANTTINPVQVTAASTLVTNGVFRITRNPMYLGFAMLLLALAVYLSRPIELLGPVLFVLYMTRFQIVPEERALRERFGLAYTDYQQRVRRWL